MTGDSQIINTCRVLKREHSIIDIVFIISRARQRPASGSRVCLCSSPPKIKSGTPIRQQVPERGYIPIPESVSVDHMQFHLSDVGTSMASTIVLARPCTCSWRHDWMTTASSPVRFSTSSTSAGNYDEYSIGHSATPTISAPLLRIGQSCSFWTQHFFYFRRSCCEASFV